MLRLAQQKEREGAGIPEGCSSPAKGWAKTRQMAPPLAQSSPARRRQGRKSKEERESEEGKKAQETEERDEPEALSPDEWDG